MRDFILKIPETYDGKEIKCILKNHFKLSDRMITKLKKDDGITLNGRKEFVNKLVHKNDLLVLKFPQTASKNITPSKLPLDILYEDDDILAVNKPADMPTHPSIHHYEDTLANACAYYFRDVPFTFRAITRLDRDTTGVVLIAKNAPAAHMLSKAIQYGEVKKEYIALCRGIPTSKRGIINAPIKREAEGCIKRCIADDGKNALSEYEVIKTNKDFFLVHLIPHTGRTHQLRLHLSHIGMPIYGDFLYGIEIPGERTRLHCRSVSFFHPFNGDNITVSAPLPDDMNLDDIT